MGFVVLYLYKCLKYSMIKIFHFLLISQPSEGYKLGISSITQKLIQPD